MLVFKTAHIDSHNVDLAIIHETGARRGEILSRKSKPRTVIVVRRCQNLVRSGLGNT